MFAKDVYLIYSFHFLLIFIWFDAINIFFYITFVILTRSAFKQVGADKIVFKELICY